MERFTKDSLHVDAAAVCDHIEQTVRQQVRGTLKRHGAVVGVSGGLDSSVVVALAVRALGPDRVLGVSMPDRDSSPESERLARLLAATFGFELIKEDITPGLLGLGCYVRRDEAIRMVFPEFDSDWRCKITIPTNILEKDTFNFFQLTIDDGSGESKSRRLPVQAYLQIVAASNLKQRVRMTTLYYHGERRNWAVLGTGNKDEHQQGFFVKYGDGGADLKPIAHLFKVQVYQLAKYLGVPQEIIARVPTTDTYSAPVTQEEFFFGLDFYHMDMLWYAMEHHIPAHTAAGVLGLTVQQVEHGYANIARKIEATEPLRLPPLEVDGSQPSRQSHAAERSDRKTSRERT